MKKLSSENKLLLYKKMLDKVQNDTYQIGYTLCESFSSSVRDLYKKEVKKELFGEFWFIYEHIELNILSTHNLEKKIHPKRADVYANLEKYMLDILPELEPYKPKIIEPNEVHWFPVECKCPFRINILKEIIESKIFI